MNSRELWFVWRFSYVVCIICYAAVQDKEGHVAADFDYKAPEEQETVTDASAVAAELEDRLEL